MADFKKCDNDATTPHISPRDAVHVSADSSLESVNKITNKLTNLLPQRIGISWITGAKLEARDFTGNW